MNWIEDMGYDGFEPPDSNSRLYDAKSANIVDLAKFILKHINNVNEKYRDMNRDIATKAIKGYNLSEKQKKCLINCYVFMEE